MGEHGIVRICSELGFTTAASYLQTMDFVQLELVQAVLASNSILIGKSLTESNFDERYGCSVLALHREGERILSDMRSVRLQARPVLAAPAASSRQATELHHGFKAHVQILAMLVLWPCYLSMSLSTPTAPPCPLCRRATCSS